MKKIVFLITIAFSFPTYAASFDCNKASNVIEKTICSDSELSNLDDSLSELYSTVQADHHDLKASQLEWIKQTRQCGSASSIADCIKRAYEDRINYLSNLGASETISDVEPVELAIDEAQQIQIQNSESVSAAPGQKTVQSDEKIEDTTAEKNSSSESEKSSLPSMFVFLLLIAGGIYYFKKRKSSSNRSSKPEINNTQELTNNEETLFNKGVFLYEKGDFDKAFDFLQEAALKNDAGSQFYLGKILIKNAESRESPSYLKGVDWFKKSAANNYQPAINELNLIESEKKSEYPAKDILLENNLKTDSTNDKDNQFNKLDKGSNKDMKIDKNKQFYDHLVELEEHWMEKNVINDDIIDCGGSIREIHFRFEDEDDGYYLVCELEVEDIDSIPEEIEENILNKIEWAFDDIRESLEGEGLDLESYLGEKVSIKKVD